MHTTRIVKGLAALALIGGVALGGTACAPADTTTAEAGEKTTSAPAKPAAKKSKPAKKAEKPTEVKASKLIADFEKNEMKADKKYKGKTLEVTGTVEEVDTDMFDEDVYILRVTGGDEFAILSVNFYDIPTDELDKIDTGDKVTVVGEFKDGGDLGVEIEKAHIA